MVFTPYITLAVVAFLIYRGMRNNEACRRAREEALGAGPSTALADPS